ncbi:MAG: DUF3592 domain-containing protein [Patescibacteria group bacterium]
MEKINHKENPRLKYLVLIGPAIGLLFLVIGIILIRNDLVARSWDDISAVVTSSTMHTRTSQSAGSTTDGSTSTFYIAKMKYNYNYKGQEYTGKDEISNSVKTKTTKIINKYPVNSTIEIKVNPEKPSKSRLLMDINPYGLGNIVTSVIGLILTLVFSFFAYMVLFRGKKN